MAAVATFTSADLDPIRYASAWHVFAVGTRNSPGVVTSVSGFDREVEWDKKKGKGTQGATLSLVQYPPAEGSFTLALWLPEHFLAWAEFRLLLKYDPKKKGTSGNKLNSSDAYDIYYPSLADLSITSVVTKKISPVTHKGRGLYETTIDMIEFIPVPKKSVVVTPSGSTATKAPAKPAGDTGDPVADAQQKEIAALMKRAADTPVG